MTDQTPNPPVPQTSGPPPTGNYAQTVPSGPRAGFGRRLVAAIVDSLILGAVGEIIGKIFGQNVATAQGGTVSYQVSGTAAILSLLISLTYYAYLEGGASGQTLGKKLLGIRVVDFNTGGPIGFGRGAIRWIGRIVSAIPCGLGYFWMLWDKNKQTWHDKFATCLVVPTSAYPIK
jgi:uncharacterized RDD family membrane protein YckC